METVVFDPLRNSAHCATLQFHRARFPGGFAQYIRVPRINVEQGTYKLPSDMSFDEGMFIEPLACVIRGQRLATIEKDDTLLAIRSGISGLPHVKLTKFKGLSRTAAVDVNSYRRALQKTKKEETNSQSLQRHVSLAAEAIVISVFSIVPLSV